MSKSLLMLALPALLGAGGPRLDRWEVIGPGGGGALFFPTISPHDPARVMIRCDMTGTYLTEDAGQSWRMFNLRTASALLTFDPVDADTIYVGGLGLWRSTDAGKSWGLVYPDPESVTGVRIAGDHGEETILTTGPAPSRMTALTVDPSDSRTLYAALGGVLQISSDWGATWSRLASLPDGVLKIYVDPRSPRQDRTLFVVGNRSVSVREAGRWRQAGSPGNITLKDVSIGFPGGEAAAVIYATADRILISEDAGLSWRDALLPGTRTEFSAIATSLAHPDVVYVSYSRLTEPSGSYWFGVARSEDRGRKWDLVWKSGNQSPANVADAWLPAAYGAGWAGNPIGLGVAATDPDVCYGTDYGRVIRTLDGGRTWKAAYSARTADGAYNTTGVDVTTSYGVHFDPFDPARLFITYTDIGLFRSETGGQSWLWAGAGIPNAWRNTTYWMEFDPEVEGRVWGVMSRTHDLPRPKMWRTPGAVAAYDGGVSLSEDGGRTWKPSSSGMAPAAATHILLDPASPTDARVLYVAGFGRGVYKSVDGGRNWALKNHGIAGTEPFAWRLARDPGGTLYLVVARRSERGTYGDQNDGALYRSVDAAETWSRLPLPEGLNGPNGLAIDPDDPRRLYLAAWGRFNSAGDVDGGVYVSADGGESWRNTLSADRHIYDVTVDPRNGVLYAAGFESSAWRSEDRGENWQRIRGFNFKWGHRVIPDPQDPAKIYITTFGGSVWHGPAAGDPDAPEDIAGPAPLRFSQP